MDWHDEIDNVHSLVAVELRLAASTENPDTQLRLLRGIEIKILMDIAASLRVIAKTMYE